MKPHLVMPMAGAGSRFFKDGYIQPKPLIMIHERPFFYWAVQSILKYVDVVDLTFVVLKKHVEENSIDEVIRSYFSDARIEVVDEVLPGPVHTVIAGTRGIRDDSPIIINDCDHMFSCSSLYNTLKKDMFREDGALLTFTSDSPAYSYIRYNSEEIIGTAEKQVVSNDAICGAYVYQNISIFNEYAQKYIYDCPYNECYMSGIYNLMCHDGRIIKKYDLDFHVEFGTPIEYEAAKESVFFDRLL